MDQVQGTSFPGTGLLATGLLLVAHPAFIDAWLLIICVWSFCRSYYFAFYVIEHYVDPAYQFSGLGSFFRYWWHKPSSKHRTMAVKPKPKTDFDGLYPAVAKWTQGGGWIEIGDNDYGHSFIRVLDSGQMIWEGEHRYASVDAALKAADQAIAKWEKLHG